MAMLTEEGLARAVEILSAASGRPLGQRTRRDESQAGGLRVDYTYDQPPSGPPAALEVTTLRDPWTTETNANLQGFADRLNDSLDKKQVGAWAVAIGSRTNLRRVEPLILKLIRAGREIRPGDYTYVDLQAAPDSQAFVMEHQALRDAGIVSVERVHSSHDRAVGVLSIDYGRAGGAIGPFDDLLVEAVDMNEAKLAASRPRETHLAVYVARFDASRWPHLTPVPILPGGVDHLWVFFRWGREHRVHEAWHAARAATAWDVRTDPTHAV